MKISGKRILYFAVATAIFLLLITSEKQRQDFLQNTWWRIRFPFINSPYIPKIERVATHGIGQCTAYIENPEYTKLIESCTQKQKDKKDRSVSLEKIHEINCEAEALINPSSPRRQIPIQVPCDIITGYDNWLKYLGSRRFIIGHTDPASSDNNKEQCGIYNTHENAIASVEKLPEIVSYTTSLTSQDAEPIIEIDNPNDIAGSTWNVHVYEIVKDTNTTHTATFNWYGVDKCTGIIKCSFSKYDNTGKLSKTSTLSEYPCN